MKKLLLNLLVFMAKDFSVLQVSFTLNLDFFFFYYEPSRRHPPSLLLDIPGREGDASSADAREASCRLPQPLVKFPLLVSRPPGGTPAVRSGHPDHRGPTAAGRLHAVSG